MLTVEVKTLNDAEVRMCNVSELAVMIDCFYKNCVQIVLNFLMPICRLVIEY